MRRFQVVIALDYGGDVKKVKNVSMADRRSCRFERKETGAGQHWPSRRAESDIEFSGPAAPTTAEVFQSASRATRRSSKRD